MFSDLLIQTQECERRIQKTFNLNIIRQSFLKLIKDTCGRRVHATEEKEDT